MSNSITINCADDYPTAIRPLRKYWVVVNSVGAPFFWSISYQRNASIEAFARGIGKEKEDFRSCWKDARKRGHNVIKVNISFDLT